MKFITKKKLPVVLKDLYPLIECNRQLDKMIKKEKVNRVRIHLIQIQAANSYIIKTL